MAAPRLRLRRGTNNPVTLTDIGEVFASGSATEALVGEPLFTNTNPTYVGLSPVTNDTEAGTGTGDFYIADSGSSFVHIGGSSYTARVDSFLVDKDPTNSIDSQGGKVIWEEGGTGTNTITLKAPNQNSLNNSYELIWPTDAATGSANNQYVLEYNSTSSQLSFVPVGASIQLETQQVPDDTGAANDYFLTFVADNNQTGSPALEIFYTEENVVLYPDKDGSGGGTISSLQITGEYVASTGYFSGTGSTDTGSVTTNFATEPTAALNTKTVNVGTGAAVNSTTNINIGSATSGATVFLGTDDNTLGSVATGAVQMDGGLGVALNATIGGDLSVVGGNIVADPGTPTNTVGLFDTSTGTVDIAGLSATLNLGNDGTDATTVNIATGATLSGNTKTVNIATNGDTGSTTAVNIGSAAETNQTTVTINGNLTVTGQQTITNIQTTNTSITDTLITLNDGVGSTANNLNDIGFLLQRGTSQENIFVGFDEGGVATNNPFPFIIAFTSSATTGSSTNIAFQAAFVGADITTPTPLDFVPIQVGALRISDSTSRRVEGDNFNTEGTLIDDVVIGHLTAAGANTEFSVTDATAGRHLYNVVIDGGSF